MILKPTKCQIFEVKNLPFKFGFNKGYFLEYEFIIYDSILLKHSEYFKTSDDMKEFCEANKIPKSELKKVWTKDIKVVRI